MRTWARGVYLAKAWARWLRWAPSDLLRDLNGGGPTPPRRLAFVGDGDFERTGEQFLGYFRDLGGLRPDARVLDIGCGIGRMALPLIEYLDAGSYAGFDVGRPMVRWCQANISARRPDFEFAWAPVYNAKYNPFGTVAGTEFRFPYPDASFDFDFATSLFTHLTADDMRHYVSEASRTLRPGGTCLFTFFLLTPEARAEVATGRAMLDFRHPLGGGAATTTPARPEEAIAYPVELVREALAEVGLRVREPIHHGLWCDTPGGLTLQDIVIAERA
jgi:SAM-dependent methyltransferase